MCFKPPELVRVAASVVARKPVRFLRFSDDISVHQQHEHVVNKRIFIDVERL